MTFVASRHVSTTVICHQYLDEEALRSHFIYLLSSLLMFFEVWWVYFLCFPTIGVARLSFSAFLLELCYNNRFFSGRDVTYNQYCHTACVTTGICPCTCRRSPGPTRAGLWTAWFCSMRWQSGWRMTSPSPLQREFTCTASTSKEPAGTAAAASSLNPSPKSSLRWCLWSGCMPWTMVRFPIHWLDGRGVAGVGGGGGAAGVLKITSQDAEVSLMGRV